MSDDGEGQIIAIKSHTAIQKTVTRCLSILVPKASGASKRRLAVKIVADASAAGKAITIAEIVKRRIQEHRTTVSQSTKVIEKPTMNEVPTDDETRKHLQGEGYEKPKKRRDAQLVIQLERYDDSNMP